MSEYIDREAAIEICEAEYQARLRMCDYCGDTVAWNIGSEIKALPAADVAPVVHGQWTAQCVVELDGGWTLEDVPYNEYQHSNPICSVCRKTALLDGGEDYVTSPYCPNCGARMDGDSDALD